MEPFRPHVAPRGFTLVEMIVVVGIIVILSAVVINGQSSFNNSLRITNTAYTVALTVRQAQALGLSSRSAAGASNAGYGTHFDISGPTGYAYFVDVQRVTAQPSWCPIVHSGLPDDKPGNCLFDSSTETLQLSSFTNGMRIQKICGHDKNIPGTRYCSNDQSSPMTVLDVVFLRPNTDSVLSGYRSGVGYVELGDASITIVSPDGNATRDICVSYAGQVSVANESCP